MKHTLALTTLALALSGCATIFNGQQQAVSIQSEPEGAAITVTNRAGEKVHAGTTPVTLTLNRGAGYFKAESYTISFTKPGFATKELVLTSTMSGWFIGNLLFGGLIGMLAVDPVTGAMYVFPDKVSETLQAEAAKTSQAGGAITVVSTERLSPEQMKQARLLTAAK